MIYDALEWVANHAAAVGLALFVPGVFAVWAWEVSGLRRQEYIRRRADEIVDLSVHASPEERTAYSAELSGYLDELRGRARS